jgi:hypothetical protein
MSTSVHMCACVSARACVHLYARACVYLLVKPCLRACVHLESAMVVKLVSSNISILKIIPI